MGLYSSKPPQNGQNGPYDIMSQGRVAHPLNQLPNALEELLKKGSAVVQHKIDRDHVDRELIAQFGWKVEPLNVEVEEKVRKELNSVEGRNFMYLLETKCHEKPVAMASPTDVCITKAFLFKN
jgi:hypothetical protein